MYDQVLVARREVKKKLNHVVLMGTGEPLDNLEQVLKFIGQITGPHSLRFSMRHITISTCGLIPGIQALMEHKLPITLAVSLHAPDDALRSQLMPVNQKYPLAQLLEVCALYATFTGRRITFEYALLAGINDKVQQAEQLASLLQGMLCHVNLISYNSVVGKGYHPTAPDKVEPFRKTLERCV